MLPSIHVSSQNPAPILLSPPDDPNSSSRHKADQPSPVYQLSSSFRISSANSSSPFPQSSPLSPILYRSSFSLSTPPPLLNPSLLRVILLERNELKEFGRLEVCVNAVEIALDFNRIAEVRARERLGMLVNACECL